MKISTGIRHIREGGKNVIRNGWMSFASISSICISLFILGVFLLLALNANHLADQIESQVEINVYLESGTLEEQIPIFKEQLGKIPEVKTIEFISKAQGLEFLREKLGAEGKEYLEGLDGEENPLPDSFKIEVTEPRNVRTVADAIQKWSDAQSTPPVYKIVYGQGTVETLFKVTNVVRNIGLIIVAGLSVTAMFLISNTIKLTIVARRKEISIMKLVGATNSFIRWPFFIEGALLGIFGSIIPVAALVYGYSELVKLTKTDIGMVMLELLPLREVGTILTALLLGIGFVIGIWGSILSVRKFLKV